MIYHYRKFLDKYFIRYILLLTYDLWISAMKIRHLYLFTDEHHVWFITIVNSSINISFVVLYLEIQSEAFYDLNFEV